MRNFEQFRESFNKLTQIERLQKIAISNIASGKTKEEYDLFTDIYKMNYENKIRILSYLAFALGYIEQSKVFVLNPDITQELEEQIMFDWKNHDWEYNLNNKGESCIVNPK